MIFIIKVFDHGLGVLEIKLDGDACFDGKITSSVASWAANITIISYLQQTHTNFRHVVCTQICGVWCNEVRVRVIILFCSILDQPSFEK